MSGVLHQARILSSETDNTIKQDQQCNVNINIKPKPRTQSIPWSNAPESKDSLYPNPQSNNQNINFTQASQPNTQQVGQTSDTPMMNQDSQSQSQHPIDKAFPLMQDRGIADLGIELDTLEKKNQFLEMIVQMYEGNPLKINSYVVCDSKLLMDMIKLLNECDKVELVIDDSDVGCGCSASSSKFIKVAKILITKDGKTEDMKYAYNDIYSTFIKYGVSLKIVT